MAGGAGWRSEAPAASAKLVCPCRADEQMDTIECESAEAAVLRGNDAKSVVLDLMQPLAARGQLIGFGWETRRNEAGRQGSLQHVKRVIVG